LRRCYQFKPNVVWEVLGKLIQNNTTYGLSDRREEHLDHVRMRAGIDKRAEKTKLYLLNIPSEIKCYCHFIGSFCLAHALIIAVAT